MREDKNGAGNGEKLIKVMLMSGLPLASPGAQYKWGPSKG